MAPQLITGLDNLAANGRRVNLIYRRSQASQETHRVLLFPECQAFDIGPGDLLDFLADVQQETDLTRWQPTPALHPVMLCCTHGKKDKCCAKFGYATYRQLMRAINEADAPVDLWESSHLGGCRLAASVIMLPSRRKYGRISEQHVVPLLEHELSENAYLPCYRGNGGLTPAQQCAEAAALEWLQNHQEGEAFRLTVGPEIKEDNAECVQVRVRWQNNDDTGVLTTLCQQQELLRVDTCADLDEGPTPSLCWRVHSIVSEALWSEQLE